MSNLRDTELAAWPYRTGSHSFCPACGSPEVRLRQVFNAKPLGTWSLAGMQNKTTGTWGWEYRCFTCGDTGPCDIREGYNARAIREWKNWSPG